MRKPSFPQASLNLMALLAGLILAQMQVHFMAWFTLAAGFCIGLSLLLIPIPLIQQCARFIIIFLIGFSWSQWRAQERLEQRLPDQLVGQTIPIVGQIVGLPQQNQYGQHFMLQPSTPIAPYAWQPELIQINVNTITTQFRVCQFWRFEAKLKPIHGQINPGSFDLENWFLQQNISAIASAKTYELIAEQNINRYSFYVNLQAVRQILIERIDAILKSHPQKGVIKALTLGEQNDISAAQWWRFAQTGTTHLVSISGLHITMLYGLFGAITFYVWRHSTFLLNLLSAQKAAIIAGVFASSSYFIIAGMAIPSQRTIIMLLVFSVSIWLRLNVPISLVWLFALCLVLTLDPFATYSIGFWLSFLSVGVLLWACSHRIAVASKIKEWIKSQWAATLGLLPLLLFIFGQFPLISPISNAFAIPLISLLITPIALLGLLDPSGSCLHLAAELMDWCDRLFAWLLNFNITSWQHPPPPFWMLPGALGGVLIMLLPKGFSARYIGVLLLLPVLLYRPPQLATGHFRALVLDVGQGLAVVIRTRNQVLLFDTGKSPNLDRVILPALRHLDALSLNLAILSHNDNDHIGGAALLLQRWPVQELLHSLPTSHPLLINSAQQAQRPCLAGQHWIWDGVQFDILWPPAGLNANNDNARSCVLRISNGRHSMIIPADITRTEEGALVGAARLARSEIVIAPHHGSKSSSSVEFIAAVQPRYVVFSSGFMNHFGHPKPEIVARYAAANAQQLISHQLGAIYFDVGDQIVLQSERQIHPHYWYTTLHP